MRIRLAVLFVVLGLPVMAAGEDMVTLEGQTYSNIVVRRYDKKGVFIEHDGGATKILYREILPELRGYYKKLALELPPLGKGPAEAEGPVGTNDLQTLSGAIYRNVVVKRIEAYAITILHDGGLAKVYFSEIPPDQREHYRTASVVPDMPAGTNDLVAADGQVFRNAELLLVEPDGLTFRHDGGVTKLQFPSLPKDLREKHGYDPQVARKYHRDMIAKKKQEKAEEEARRRAAENPNIDRPVSIFNVKSDRDENGLYRIRFAIRNYTDQVQTIRAIPYIGRRAVVGGKNFRIPAKSGGKRLQLLVPINPPERLTIYCGDYQTNRTLRW